MQTACSRLLECKAVEHHARARGDVGHGVHNHAHSKAVQQLWPQLALLPIMQRCTVRAARLEKRRCWAWCDHRITMCSSLRGSAVVVAARSPTHDS